MKAFASKRFKRITTFTAAFLLAVSTFTAFGPLFLSQTTNAATAPVFSNVPASLAGNYVSHGFEAQGTAEFGAELDLDGTNRNLESATVTLSSWACEAGAWSTNNCVTTPGATFNHDLTVKFYNVDGSHNITGSPIVTSTQNFDIPYRPSTDFANCTDGRWFNGTTCFNGYATNVDFNLSLLGVVLPNKVAMTVSYDTNHYGANPIGVTGGYDSLNVVVMSGVPTTGSYGNNGVVYRNGVLNTGYTDQMPAFKINASNVEIAVPTNLQPVDGSFTNDHAFSMTWNTVAGATRYEYQTSNSKVDSNTLGPLVYSDASASSGNYDLGVSTITRHNNGTPEATYFWQVRAGDDNGNWSPWSVINGVTVDTTKPSTPVLAEPSNGKYLSTNEFDFDWNDSTDASPLTYEFQSSQDPSRDGNDVLNGSNIWHSGVLPTSMIHSSGAGDGYWFYQVRAKDAAGNYSDWSHIWSVVIDQQAPTATINFDGIGPAFTGFTVQFNEDVNAVEASNPANYFLNNWPGASGSGDLAGDADVDYNAVTHKATVTFTDPGWYISAEQQWGIKNIHDLASNIVTPNPTTTYSSPLNAPTTPVINAVTSPTSIPILGWSWSASTDPTNLGAASGVKGYQYAFVKQGDAQVWVFTNDTNFGTEVFEDGTYELRVRALDNAGNISGEALSTVVVDTIDPVVTVDGSSSTSTTPLITGTITDDNDARVFVSIDGAAAVEAVVDNLNNTWSYQIVSPLTIGSHSVIVIAQDTAGNNSDPAGADVVVQAVSVEVAPGVTPPITTTTTPTATPLITNPAAFAGVLGTDTDVTDNDGTAEVEGASTLDNVAALDTDATDGSIFGLAWYWWILILAAIAGLIWGIIAAVRRRGQES